MFKRTKSVQVYLGNDKSVEAITKKLVMMIENRKNLRHSIYNDITKLVIELSVFTVIIWAGIQGKTTLATLIAIGLAATLLLVYAGRLVKSLMQNFSFYHTETLTIIELEKALSKAKEH